MATITDDDPILFVGKRGPVDWVCHRAAATTSDGNAAASCSDKGARRAFTVREHEKPFVTYCPACWKPEEIPNHA